MTPATVYLFRFRYEVLGGHTHVRLFAGRGTLSLGKCGDLVFRNEEWHAFVKEVNRGKAGGDIEFVPERGDCLPTDEA
jgi:hypothetical protein